MHLNGNSNLGPPSRADILLETLISDIRRVEARVEQNTAQTAELRGEMRSGFRTLNANDRELFEQNREIRDRQTRTEMRRASGRARTDTAGSQRLTAWIRARSPTLPEIVLALLMMAVALGLVAPERVTGLQPLRPATSSAP